MVHCGNRIARAEHGALALVVAMLVAAFCVDLARPAAARTPRLDTGRQMAHEHD